MQHSVRVYSLIKSILRSTLRSIFNWMHFLIWFLSSVFRNSIRLRPMSFSSVVMMVARQFKDVNALSQASVLDGFNLIFITIHTKTRSKLTPATCESVDASNDSYISSYFDTYFVANLCWELSRFSLSSFSLARLCSLSAKDNQMVLLILPLFFLRILQRIA